MTRRAIFLDRDGVLIKSLKHKNKPVAIDKFEKIKILRTTKIFLDMIRKNFLLIMITNQPDVTRGKVSYPQLNKMHNYLKKKIRYDSIYINTSISKKDYYRKPNPGMLMKAIKKNMIDIIKTLYQYQEEFRWHLYKDGFLIKSFPITIIIIRQFY